MRYVLAVAESRNFTRAAEATHVVQSALSQQIGKLERELGVDLFSRSSRRVELTAAGEAFLPWARTALDAVDRAAAEAIAADGVIGGPLRIGLIPTPSALDVPGFLRTLREVHPEVTAQLRVGGSDQLIVEVREGTLDLALVGLADGVTPARVDHRPLAREALVAVLPDGYPATRSTVSLTLADLAPEPFADFPAGGPGRIQSDLAFREAGLVRDVRYEAATPGLIRDVVAAGLAVALLPESFAHGTGVRVLPVVDGPHRTEYLVWDSFAPSAATRAALTLLEDSDPPTGADDALARPRRTVIRE